ncbi:unnamed protein product, partial [Rotaria sp. Silwood2]
THNRATAPNAVTWSSPIDLIEPFDNTTAINSDILLSASNLSFAQNRFNQTIVLPIHTISMVSSLTNSLLFELCPHFEFHILLIQLALLSVSSFMHLYFLLKALIMIIIVTIFVFYSYYSNIYNIIANNYGIASSTILIETTFEVIFFILLLIGLDRRVQI